jgi:predicted dehydrogenase
MRTIRAGVIGTGFIGPAHIEALRRIPGVDVLALASNEPMKGREIADAFGIQRVYENWQALIDDREIEVVHNCTPNNLHFVINKAAIVSGKHIVSEKPLTISSHESGELVRLARKRKVVHAVDFNYRFYPLVQHARQMIQSGELGSVYIAHGHYLQDWLYDANDYNWRLEPKISGPSRAVADIGSHWCDVVQFVTGLTIAEVCADLDTVHRVRHKPASHVDTFKGHPGEKAPRRVSVRIGTEDLGIVMLRFSNGAHGVVTVSQVSAGRKNREWFEIDGSKLSLAWDQENPNSLWIGHREKPNEIIIKDPSLMREPVRKYAHYPGGHPEGYPVGLLNLFHNVYSFIRERKDPTRENADFPTFDDGHRENLIVEAVLKSNRVHKWAMV